MKKTQEHTTRFSQTAEHLFRLSHRRTIVNAFDSGKAKYRRTGIILAAILIVILYFCSPYAAVKSVSVTGSSILSRNYIESISGVQTGSPFYLQIPFIVTYRLKKDPVIQNAQVSWEKDNVIHIAIEEKRPIGYRYNLESPEILFDDGSTAPIESSYLDIIADIPIIKGFTEEEQKNDLCKAFQKVNDDIIQDIAEVSQYSLEYDDEAICIQMRSGIYFLADYYNLFTINEYLDYYAAMKDKNKCLYAFSSTDKNTVFETDCPWNKSEQEYWTNEDGSIRTNAEGVQIAKHYYTLDDGSYALDESGSKIAIPIDENGNETADADFQAHYEAGYYATGTLVIPDDNADN